MIRNIQIAVIDDGISEKLYNIGNLDFDIEISSILKIEHRKNYNPYLPSHGTTCAAIIKNNSPNAILGSIKILNDKSKSAVKDQLIKSIEWCATNDVKIINLSIGTINFRDFDDIKDCINRVADEGVIIVAACDNDSFYTMPACLTNVIGVKCMKIYINDQYEFNPYAFDGIDISASGLHYLVDTFGNSRYTSTSNSFAAPLITAKVYDIVNMNPKISLEEIKKRLYKRAHNCRNEYNPYICISTDWISRNIDNKDNIDNIEIPYNNQNLMKIERKLWHPLLYKKLIKKSIKRSFKLDVPIILICDNSKDHNRSILMELNKMFREDGYYSVSVSTELKEVYLGAEYMTFKLRSKMFLSNIYKKYNCDVILFRVKSKNYLKLYKKAIKCDIMLEVGNSFIKFISNNNKNTEYISMEYDNELFIEIVNEVYRKIINFYLNQK